MENNVIKIEPSNDGDNENIEEVKKSCEDLVWRISKKVLTQTNELLQKNYDAKGNLKDSVHPELLSDILFVVKCYKDMFEGGEKKSENVEEILKSLKNIMKEYENDTS